MHVDARVDRPSALSGRTAHAPVSESQASCIWCQLWCQLWCQRRQSLVLSHRCRAMQVSVRQVFNYRCQRAFGIRRSVCKRKVIGSIPIRSIIRSGRFRACGIGRIALRHDDSLGRCKTWIRVDARWTRTPVDLVGARSGDGMGRQSRDRLSAECDVNAASHHERHTAGSPPFVTRRSMGRWAPVPSGVRGCVLPGRARGRCRVGTHMTGCPPTPGRSSQRLAIGVYRSVPSACRLRSQRPSPPPSGSTRSARTVGHDRAPRASGRGVGCPTWPGITSGNQRSRWP